jgi:hypothetical protein
MNPANDAVPTDRVVETRAWEVFAAIFPESAGTYDVGVIYSDIASFFSLLPPPSSDWKRRLRSLYFYSFLEYSVAFSERPYVVRNKMANDKIQLTGVEVAKHNTKDDCWVIVHVSPSQTNYQSALHSNRHVREEPTM